MAKLFRIFVLLISLHTFGHVQADFTVDTHDLRITLGDKAEFTLSQKETLERAVNVTFEVEHAGLVKLDPPSIFVNEKMTEWNITVFGVSPGHSTISVNATPANITHTADAFVRVTIEKSMILFQISTVMGWIYFLAWSISFYPQIFSNYRRKSVVGLNFDFLSLNLVGFIMYALFNCGLYWIPSIETEYFRRYPKGLNPVLLNDIFFAVHAVFATGFTIVQCCIYERGTQRVSTTARVIHIIFMILILVPAVLAMSYVIDWLDFLYCCSYIKLSITLIKYIPQAYSNYKRKSTVGWSIGNIFLDFTGGILSMLQMIVNAYNYDDWDSIFGDKTKFGLGLFSVVFDIFFLVQHYVLYRDSSYCELPGTHDDDDQADISTADS